MAETLQLRVKENREFLKGFGFLYGSICAGEPAVCPGTAGANGQRCARVGPRSGPPNGVQSVMADAAPGLVGKGKH